ncbi:MAG: hypothetical protein ACREBU_20185 [Nitrososphaera sp.]
MSEIINADDSKTVERLLWLVDGSTYAAEIEVIKQHVVAHGIEPTLDNVKRHLVNHRLLPMELMDKPEQAIIFRAGRAEYGD